MIRKLILITLSFICLVGYKSVDKPYEWEFPYDHGAHNDYQVEWWYLTGHMQEKGRPNYNYGFEFTIFRIGNSFMQTSNPWSFKNIFITHFTITDEDNNQFNQYEFTHRESDGISYANTGNLDVKNGPFSLKLTNDRFTIDAHKGNHKLHLELKNTKPIIFHGDNGLHQKTKDEGSASYYYSMTRLQGTGELMVGEKLFEITNTEAWMDHEVFTTQSTDQQFGWDWFAIQFDDNTELMIYQLRNESREILDTANGTYVNQDGTTEQIVFGEYSLTPLDWWEDPKTGISYPIEWQVQVPKLNIDIKTSATLKQQVVRPESLLKQTMYWEGRCLVSGSHSGKAYIELVGYKNQ